jgi:hypothetical protein
MLTRFWLEGLNTAEYSEDFGVDEKIILKWIMWKQLADVDWINMA